MEFIFASFDNAFAIEAIPLSPILLSLFIVYIESNYAEYLSSLKSNIINIINYSALKSNEVRRVRFWYPVARDWAPAAPILF